MGLCYPETCRRKEKDFTLTQLSYPAVADPYSGRQGPAEHSFGNVGNVGNVGNIGNVSTVVRNAGGAFGNVGNVSAAGPYLCVP